MAYGSAEPHSPPRRGGVARSAGVVSSAKSRTCRSSFKASRCRARASRHPVCAAFGGFASSYWWRILLVAHPPLLCEEGNAALPNLVRLPRRRTTLANSVDACLGWCTAAVAAAYLGIRTTVSRQRRAAACLARRTADTIAAACLAGRTAGVAAACLARRTAAVAAAACAVIRTTVIRARAAFLARRTAVPGCAARAYPLGRTPPLPERERSQNRARQPAEDELQGAGTRHRCRQNTAETIKEFRHHSSWCFQSR